MSVVSLDMLYLFPALSVADVIPFSCRWLFLIYGDWVALFCPLAHFLVLRFGWMRS